MQINDYIGCGRLGDLFIVARYLYRMGSPVMDDEVYDRIETHLKVTEYPKYREYLERSYDDDPVPQALLEELGIEVEVTASPPELYSYLEEEKSNSIRAIRDWEQVFEFTQSNKGKRFVASLKLDGVNSKILYVDNIFALALSRGRKGNSLDYSKGAAMIMPRKIAPDGYLKITGECYVESGALPYLRDKYNQGKYKTPKSAAISMLRVKHDEEDYDSLKFRAFNAEGGFASVTEMYKFLELQGFTVPPFLVIESCPSDKVEFKEWLQVCVLDKICNLGECMPSDGIVFEVDDLSSSYREHNQYSERQLALKFGQWDFGYEKGVITDILIEQRRVYKSVRILIKPMLTKDGCKAECINSFNPSILIHNDLYVGKTVYFEKNSNAVNILIHGEKLEKVMERERVAHDIKTG